VDCWSRAAPKGEGDLVVDAANARLVQLVVVHSVPTSDGGDVRRGRRMSPKCPNVRAKGCSRGPPAPEVVASNLLLLHSNRRKSFIVRAIRAVTDSSNARGMTTPASAKFRVAETSVHGLSVLIIANMRESKGSSKPPGGNDRCQAWLGNVSMSVAVKKVGK